MVVNFSSVHKGAPPPSPLLLALHATCARVAHLSGAAEVLEKLDQDAEKAEEAEFLDRLGLNAEDSEDSEGSGVPAFHGSSAHLVNSLTSTCATPPRTAIHGTA
jgi:hypothetical protein